MAAIKVSFNNITDFNIGSKVITVDKDADDKIVVTHVAFNIDAVPGDFNDILIALANKHAINVTFESPQTKLDV